MKANRLDDVRFRMPDASRHGCSGNVEVFAAPHRHEQGWHGARDKLQRKVRRLS